MNDVMKIYNRLYDVFGPQHWWPAEGAFEVVVGAILTQQAPWKNVEKAINNLKKESALGPSAISKMSLPKLERMIKPAGFYKIKSKRLKKIAALYNKIEECKKLPVSEARKHLLKIDGIGPETADSILLYAFNMPTFVVDAYTKRFVKRYGFSKKWKRLDYETIKNFFERNTKYDVKVYNEFHALLVELGKKYCKTKPVCDKCPLNMMCEKRCEKD